MDDDTFRFLAEHFSIDFARWLLGEFIVLTISENPDSQLP